MNRPAWFHAQRAATPENMALSEGQFLKALASLREFAIACDIEDPTDRQSQETYNYGLTVELGFWRGEGDDERGAVFTVDRRTWDGTFSQGVVRETMAERPIEADEVARGNGQWLCARPVEEIGL